MTKERFDETLRRRVRRVALLMILTLAFLLPVLPASAQRTTLVPRGSSTAAVETSDFYADDLEPEEDANDVSAATSGRESLSAEAVRAAIDGAVSYLQKRQTNKGSWQEYPGYEPGTTALCALALLNAGLDKNDPTLAAALEYLRGFSALDQNQTYPISLQTMVFCIADPVEYRAEIESNLAWLVARQMKTRNDHFGGWSYVGNRQESERADNSNSQFAILALFEAELAGFRIDDDVWNNAENYWLRMQNDDGSWGYRSSTLNAEGFPSGYGTGSMTCAGIASLAICSGVREAARARLEGDRAHCCEEVEDEIALRISRGLNWLGKHFSVNTNPGRAAGSDSYFYYYLYGLERVGRLTANRFVGQSDWYREGAETLLRRKGVLSEFWNAQKDFANNSCVTTSFALLFLSKGRWPTLISKLKYGEENQWNEHPNDLAHLTERVEKEWDQRMVWQTIDSRKATLDDLLQTPILAISGVSDPIPENPDEKKTLVQNLRGYLEQGGFIFAEALDGDVSFEKGFRQLMREVLAEDGGGELTLLEPNHPIWSAEKPMPVEYVRPLLGIDFGCRTSVVFAPAYRPQRGPDGQAPSVFDDRPSLSCLWEAATKRPRGFVATNPPSARALEEQEAAFILGVNICAYATNRQMKFKDEIAADVGEELEKHKEVRNSLFAGILEYGGSSCAPRAIPNLMKTIRSRLGIPVQLYVPRTSLKNDDVFDYPTLFMHGRNAFSFNEEERERLRLYFERGGFLFVNAVCASPAFQSSLQDELAAVLPGEQLVDVPADDPLFTGAYGGFKIATLQYRLQKLDREGRSTTETINSPPILKGIKRDERWILLFSPFDVSCALENNMAANCEGLTQTSAFYLATNVLFYAAESF
ncbi:MAG: DUF4159 domain-containing protein [Thermoguttaceae bacterium]|jgi:hypothetical protein